MQDRTFEQTVDALLRPERPAPAEYVRVLVVHGGITPPLALGDEAKVVHEQLAVSRNQKLDVKGTPDFDLIIADVTDEPDVLETVFRFLFVRRPAVFVLLNQFSEDPDYMENVTKDAGDMGYAVSFERPTGSLVGLGVGTLIGVMPGWVTPELPADADPWEYSAGWVIGEAVKLARVAGN